MRCALRRQRLPLGCAPVQHTPCARGRRAWAAPPALRRGYAVPPLGVSSAPVTLNPPSPAHPTVTFEHSPIFSIPCSHHMCVHPLSNILRPAAAPAVHQSRRLSRGAPVRVSAPRRPPSAASRLPVPPM